uniref:Uncharacterized protein n=1 Tax=Schistocephalus solidus TaxID=70667 RepID=A0A0X3NUY0_SCHSO
MSFHFFIPHAQMAIVIDSVNTVAVGNRLLRCIKFRQNLPLSNRIIKFFCIQMPFDRYFLATQSNLSSGLMQFAACKRHARSHQEDNGLTLQLATGNFFAGNQ